MKVRWRKLNRKELKHEYEIEYLMKDRKRFYGEEDPFPTFEDFSKAYSKATLVLVNKSVDREISYRSRTSSRKQLRSLISTYRSWPEFRNDETLDKLYGAFDVGATLPAPIILVAANGAMSILGGNTRADVAMQIDKAYKAVMVQP